MLILLVLLIFFAALGVPLAFAIGASCVSYILIYAPNFIAMLPQRVWNGAYSELMIAMPLFMLAGELMNTGGITQRIINFCMELLRPVRGGLGEVNIVASMIFGGISGSSVADTSALGSILIPAMDEAGYDKGTASALMAASGGIGIVIPPSIAFVVYASIADASIGKLFAGGFIPGILCGFAFYAAAKWASRNNNNIKLLPKASGKERLVAFKDAVWGLLMPVIILGGIYGGIFTPTEAAGVAVIYGLVVGLFVYREIKLKQLWKLFVDSAVSSATVMFIVANAAVFAWLLTTGQIAASMSSAILSLTSNKIVILLLINLIFLVAGCFLDANSAFYILVPIMVPIMSAMNIDPIHFGVFATVNLAIGLVTPPVGINLYVACRVADLPVAELCKKIIPFLVTGLIALLIITYIPALTMFIPNMVSG